MSNKVKNPMKVITGPNTRWSYCNVWQPKSINGGTPKYSVSLIIPKSDTVTINKIKAAIEAAYKEGEAKLKGNGRSVPALSVLKTPLRDGDAERPDDEAYANAYFVNANSATAPGIVDADRQPILDTSEVYSGVYYRRYCLWSICAAWFRYHGTIPVFPHGVPARRSLHGAYAPRPRHTGWTHAQLRWRSGLC